MAKPLIDADSLISMFETATARQGEQLKKASESAGAPMAGAWGQVLEKMQASGTLSGAQASAASEQITNMAEQMQGAMRSTRAASLRAAQALAESYTAMVSGVLLGMSEALQSGAAASKPAASAASTKGGKK